MKKIPNRLWGAIVAVADMKHLAVAQILRKRGFGYEADRMDELTTAFEQAIQNEKGEERCQKAPSSRMLIPNESTGTNWR